MGHTVSAIVLDDPSHAHGRSAVQQSPGDDGVRSGDGLASARDGQYPVVHALHDLANTSFHACFIAQVGDVLAAFPNNDTSFLGRHNCPQGQQRLCILFISLWRRIPVRPKAGLIVTELKLIHRLGEVSAIGRNLVLRGRHVDGRGWTGV